MTLMDVRETVLLLKGKITDPDDRRDLETAVKNVAIYRTVGRVDEETFQRLRAKYDD